MPRPVMVERVRDIGQRAPRRRRRPSSRPAPRPSRRSAARDLPDTTSVVTGAVRRSARSDRQSGACSSTTCAFVPPNPNDDTPARRGRSTAANPGLLGNDFQPQLVERDVRIRVLEVQVRRDLPALHGQHRLDEPGDARRGLQMAEVRLDRADQQRRVCGRPRPSTVPSARASIGIAQQRSGAVGLDVVDLGGCTPALA